jgi:CRP/FNR family cyclic AMP-dependent transcriptional regulator
MDLQVFRELDLFHNLDPIQLAHIASIVTERPVKKNDKIFEEGDEPDYFYIVTKGKVRISKVVSGFGEEALAVLPQGAYFGEMELIDATPRSAQAVAHEDCLLHQIALKDFHELINTDQELAVALLWNIVRTLSRRLNATNDKVAATFALALFK